MLRCPLFVASLGNPSPSYRNTLHSAGHVVLSALQLDLLYPPFSKNRLYANGLLSQGDDFTLWQSPTLMNVSGPAVANAWRAFVGELPNEARGNAKLVVVHDELDRPFGTVTTKYGGSARGHNGLKSVTNSLGGMPYARIRIGIGRPKSRDSTDVANYVLKKMNPVELRTISSASDAVLKALVDLRDGQS